MAIFQLALPVPILKVVAVFGWRQIGAACFLCGFAMSAWAQVETNLFDMHPDDAYGQCIGQIDGDPEQAYEAALAWRDLSNDLRAAHCVALALIALDSYEMAASRLENLADSMKAFPAATRAEVLAQAGRAWLLAQDAERAYAALTAGLTTDPENVELLIDRGEILAVAQSYWDAIDDFNLALEIAPQRVDALVFRAAAYRLLDVPDLASEDIEKALSLVPNNPEALIERGMLRRLAGNADGARDDWLQVIRTAPESRAAQIARANIERLDVGR